MPKIYTESERERLDRIFDEIAGKMPEEPKKTQKEIDYENRRERVDRLSSQEPSEFIASVDDRIRTKAFKTDLEEILFRQLPEKPLTSTFPEQRHTKGTSETPSLATFLWSSGPP